MKRDLCRLGVEPEELEGGAVSGRGLGIEVGVAKEWRRGRSDEGLTLNGERGGV